MNRLIYLAILAGSLAGCATTHTQYYWGCFDGISAAKFMLNTPAMREPDMVDGFCKVVERNREQKTREKP